MQKSNTSQRPSVRFLRKSIFNTNNFHESGVARMSMLAQFDFDAKTLTKFCILESQGLIDFEQNMACFVVEYFKVCVCSENVSKSEYVVKM